jgi:hypothetical protein
VRAASARACSGRPAADPRVPSPSLRVTSSREPPRLILFAQRAAEPQPRVVRELSVAHMRAPDIRALLESHGVVP